MAAAASQLSDRPAVQVSARDLQLDTPGAWKSFFLHATAAFPLIAASVQEPGPRSAAGAGRGGGSGAGAEAAEAALRRSEGELLRDLAGRYKREAALSLGQLRRLLGQAPLPSARDFGERERELCALEAVAAARALELDALRARGAALEEELESVTRDLHQVRDVELRLAEHREALAQQRQAREHAAREAEEMVAVIEGLCSRLRELRGRRRALQRRAAAATCRAEGAQAGADASLAFRGGHRLHLFGLSAAHAGGGSGLVRLRFEPWLPDRKGLPEASQGKMVDRLEELLARIWLQATASTEHGLTVDVTADEVPDVVQRLDFALLSAAVLVCRLVKASMPGVGDAVSPSKRQRR